jgi:NADPH-dependent 2,4-dienoyl-CoA reductase/sulfur reductase-like enzyme/nitrite reductase/ring-hydroxylating ferredoxin subunit
MSQSSELSGPDLSVGVSAASLQDDQPLLGYVGDQAVMLVKTGGQLLATAATCTHYGGPLARGLVVDGTVRCPWHHACFDLRTGLAKGPALTPLACFDVIHDHDLVRVGGQHRAKPPTPFTASALSSVVIVGAGPAGTACAELLRRLGYEGPITLVAGEPPGPVDRPNLSKDYLAGSAPEEWLPLRDAAFFAEQRIELVLGDPAARLEPKQRRLALQSGRELEYGALVLATGAEPRRLEIPGSESASVHVLRSLADSRRIIEKAAPGARAVVIGSSFIGLEVAASLRARQVKVTVVSSDQVPLARVLGEKLGAFVRVKHEERGVELRLGRRPQRIDPSGVHLDDGSTLEADFVVQGVGVRPRTELAEAAGLKVDQGIVTDAQLCTSDPQIYAAGDVASYPDPWSGARVRIEHFAAAERQGQAVARTLLGQGSPFHDVPFFWSAHYDMTLAYVGHAESWDRILERGDLGQGKYAAAYEKNGKILAVACLDEDMLGLQIEAAMEAGDAPRVAALFASPAG